MSPEHEALLRRNAEEHAKWRAWRSPFIVRAALMFNVPTSEVTLAQYAAAVERTQQDTVPPRYAPPT
jgi:hypothetical protein